MRRWDGIDEFIAVCDTGSFSRAAQRLGVSTSHVSREVARLEDRVRTRLFHRTTRRVTATEEGLLLSEAMRPIIEQRDAAFSAAMRPDGDMRGQIRLTCSTAYGERFVAPLVQQFLQGHAGLSVHLDLSNRLVDIIGEGYDLAIRTGQIGDPRLSGRRIGARRLILSAAPAYLARRSMPREPGDIAGHDCLIGSSGSWRFQQGEDAHVIAVRGRFHCNSGFAVVQAALAGMGLCQLPAFYVEPHLAAGKLIRVLSAFEPPEQPIWAAFPGRGRLSAKVGLFLDFLSAGLPD